MPPTEKGQTTCSSSAQKAAGNSRRKDPGFFRAPGPRLGCAKAAKDECADRVRRNNYRDERQERVVDEGAGVDRDLVEAEQKGERRRHDVCRPRKGEKAMKTPIEKASAVRSGGSSIASRRRNAARNIFFAADFR
jgi:hypothetical protein